jgi:NDP-sugar pyrophosphorylase family protein
MLTPADFFNLDDPFVAEFFDGCQYAWEPLVHLGAHLARLLDGQRRIAGTVMDGAFLGDAPLFIGAGARIEPGAYILGPAYIAPGAVVRHGAFLRENVILCAGAICGHATEIKNSLLLPGAHAPHFNYVGDSILGARVNLGAGTRLSNLTMTSRKDPLTGRRPTLHIPIADRPVDTGLAKLGAILGDEVQTGCNAVLNPGALVGPRTLIYANVSLRRGFYPADSLIKLRQEQEIVTRRP